MLSTLKTDGPVDLSNPSTELLAFYPLPTVLLNRDMEIAAANGPVENLFGISTGRLQGQFFPDLFHEKYRIGLYGKLNTISGKMHCRVQFLSPEKEMKFVDLYINLLPGITDMPFLITAVDSTAAVHADEEINKYRTYINNSSEGIFCLEFNQPLIPGQDVDAIIDSAKNNCYLSECNDAMAKMYGFEKAEDLKGVLTEQLMDFSDPTNLEYFRYFLSNGYRVINAESHEKDRFGNSLYFLNNLIGIVEEGKLVRIWGTQQDITERKKTEDQLKMLASLVEQTSDILTAADCNFYPLTWNSAAEKIYGVSAEQALGKDLSQYFTIDYGSQSRAQVRQAILDEGEWRGEAHFIRPTDGKCVFLWMCFKSMYDEKGKHLGYLVSAIDMTERKESESRLMESENRFRSMADSSPVMIWMSDDNNKITYLNQKWIDFTGIDINGDISMGWSDMVHKDDVVRASKTYEEGYASRQEVVNVYRLLSSDGTWHWVHDVSVPRFLADGTFLGYIGSVVDIQDQKEKEMQLRKQAIILENVSDLIVATDLEFKVTSLNAAAEFYYEKTEAEAKGHLLSKLVEFTFYDCDLETVIENLVNNDGWSGEASFVISTGETKYFHYSLKGIFDDENQKIGYISTGRDITEKKLALEKLRKSEQFFRQLNADSLDGMILLDKEGLITFCSPAVKNVLGYEVEEVEGKNAFEFVHHEDLIWAAESFQREVKENPEIKFIVVRLKKKSGGWIWCMVRGHNLLHNPFVNGIVVYFHDDTLRKQASDALKESEKKFRSLIRDLKVGVFLADNLGKIMMCNDALCDLLSTPEEYILGKRVYDLLSSEMVDESGNLIPMEKRPLTRALATKQPIKDSVVGIRHPITRMRCWIMVNADPILDEFNELKHVVCSVMDLTERKKLEERLVAEQIAHQKQLAQATIDGQEAERKEIGKELHDNFGQQLTTIKLFLDLAKSTANEQTQEMINMGLKGISDVINEIRAMSRSLVPSTLQDLGLIESLQELVDSIERTQVISVDLHCGQLDEEEMQESQKLAIFRIVQEQLNNIVKHANATQVVVRLKENNNQYILEIEDDGCGMDQAKLRKGLGFINIRNRAELLGGTKELISTPGNGCLIKVTLPRAS